MGFFRWFVMYHSPISDVSQQNFTPYHLSFHELGARVHHDASLFEDGNMGLSNDHNYGGINKQIITHVLFLGIWGLKFLAPGSCGRLLLNSFMFPLLHLSPQTPSE